MQFFLLLARSVFQQINRLMTPFHIITPTRHVMCIRNTITRDYTTRPDMYMRRVFVHFELMAEIQTETVITGSQR
jgi:hypothetical protein